MNAKPPIAPWSALALVGAVCLCAWSCASTPYHYGYASGGSAGATASEDKPDGRRQVAIVRGKRQKVLDGMSDVLALPRRVVMPELPDRRHVTDNTTQIVRRYLEKNDLADVRVEIRDYSPRRQWRRLRDSEIVSPAARYTLGTLSVLHYTLLPGKVFGRNRYNAFTNTLYVNSDAPSLLLHEAAYAKNIRQQKLPGAYALSAELPVLSLRRQVDSARDVIGYAQAEQDWGLEEDAYREVYPHVGSEALGAASTFVPLWWAGPIMGLGGAAIGGVAGHTVLTRREREREDAMMSDVLGTNAGVRQASFDEPSDDGRTSAPRHYVRHAARSEVMDVPIDPAAGPPPDAAPRAAP